MFITCIKQNPFIDKYNSPTFLTIKVCMYKVQVLIFGLLCVIIKKKTFIDAKSELSLDENDIWNERVNIEDFPYKKMYHM